MRTPLATSTTLRDQAVSRSRSTSPPVLAEARRLLAEGIDTLVVDLTELTFVDSSGLGILVACWRRAEAAGVEFRLEHPNKDVAMTLHITGLDQILPIIV